MAMQEKWRLVQRAACDKTLTAAAMSVLLRLCDRANADQGFTCFPSVESLCVDTGICERGVRKAITLLVARGYITANRKGGRGRASDFRLLVAPKGGTEVPALGEKAAQECRVSGTKAEPLFRKGGTPVPPNPVMNPEGGEGRTKVTNPHDLKAGDFSDYARDKAPGIDVARQLERFRNHADEKGRTFKDAAAGFRNWLLKAADFEAERQHRASPPFQEGHRTRDPATFDAEDWRVRVTRYFEEPDAPWSSTWGPRPDEVGCRCPPEILREHSPEPPRIAVGGIR